jgi:hypothetical protein
MRSQQTIGTRPSLPTKFNQSTKPMQGPRDGLRRPFQFLADRTNGQTMTKNGAILARPVMFANAKLLRLIVKPSSPELASAVIDRRRSNTSILKQAPILAEYTHALITATPTEAISLQNLSTNLDAATPASRSSLTSPSVSFWTLWRDGPSQGALATNGQIGGSQSGVRARLPIANVGERTLLNLSSRLSLPLADSRGAEASLGASLAISGKIPIEFIVERRIPIDNSAKQSWSLTAVSGINAVQLPQNLQIDGYLQTGIVGAQKRRPFVGGNIVVSRAADLNRPDRMRLGIGLWGDAQSGLSRIDVGPEISFNTKSAGLPMRISAQWRFRVAGHANPSSGPAVVIGGDF